MNIPRIIPCLLLKGEGLVKGVRFKKHKYIGDPLNAVKIFNDKEVDELIFLDINASVEGRSPNIALIQDIADECYMPFCFGGGIKTIEDIRQVIAAGAEKVSLNSVIFNNPKIIKQASEIFGSQSIVVSIDIKHNWFGHEFVYSPSTKKKYSNNILEFAQQIEAAGAGEILLNAVDQDGRMNGYDLDLIQRVASSVNIPVIASCGAGKVQHFKEAILAGASAVAAGSMFVYVGKYNAVLINYPSYNEISKAFKL